MKMSMTRKLLSTGAVALVALGFGVAAAETHVAPPHQHWHFKGPFGTYDRASAQRGYQVFSSVCERMFPAGSPTASTRYLLYSPRMIGRTTSE